LKERRDATRAPKLGKLLWFLRRPALYGELARKVRRRLSVRGRGAADESRWCADRALGTGTAVRLLTGGAAATPLAERYPDEIRRARNAAAGAPVRMGGAANLELLYQLAEHLEARSVIETGVAYGWSALALLLSLRRRADSLLVSTDLPYAVSGSEAQVGVAVPPELRAHWRIIKRPDRHALPEALMLLPTIDMCHYDSAKAYHDRMWAYPKLWEALRPGGLFLSDDVGDNAAFRDFCDGIAEDPVIVRKDPGNGERYVGVVVKPGTKARLERGAALEGQRPGTREPHRRDSKEE
jgi:predicted O-methyltransferase YrrM